MGEVIRRCSVDDIPRLMKLFKQVYRYNRRLQEFDYFEWQFRGGLYTDNGNYNLLVTEEASKINGFLGYVPVEFYYKNKVHRGCWPQNWASTSRGYNGITMMLKLVAEYDNLFFSGLTNDSVNILKMLQIPILMKLPRWIGVLDSASVSRLFEIQNPDDLHLLKQSSEHLISLESEGQCYRCKRFKAEEEFGFNRWPSIEGYTRRTGGFLNWRYFGIPGHNYRGLRTSEGEFAVYRIETILEHKEAVVRILEWNFTGDSALKAMAMIVKEGLDEGAVLIDFFCTADVIGAELEKAGFFAEEALNSQMPDVFRPINYSGGIVVAMDMPPHREKRDLDFGRWYITKGDSDVDRIKL